MYRFWGRNWGSSEKVFVLYVLQKLILRRSFLFSYLKASPLPPAPLAVAGFLVAGLVAWQYSDRCAGLVLVLLVLSFGVFAGSLVSGC